VSDNCSKERIVWVTPVYIFALASIITLLTFGTELYSHLYRNLNIIDSMQAGVAMGQGVYSTMYNSKSLMYYYAKYFLNILEYGVVTLIVSLLYKFIAFLVVYKVSMASLGNVKQSIAISLLFLTSVSSITHGMVGGGLWLYPVVVKSSLSLLVSLLALLMFLRKSYLWSGLLFGLSIHIHPLYAVTAIAYMGVGVMIVAFNTFTRQEWIKILFSLVPIFGSVLYVANFSYSGYEIGADLPTISDWYRYVFFTDPDDAALTYTFEIAGAGLLPIILLGAYFSWSDSDKQPVEYLMIGSFVVIVLSLLMELLHSNGIFVGAISEYFISIQLRRGIWLACFLALIIIVKNINPLLTCLKDRDKVIMIGGAASVYLVPSVTSIILLSSYLLYLYRNKVVFLLYLLVLSMILLNFLGGHIILIQELKSLVLLVAVCFLVITLHKMDLCTTNVAFTIAFIVVVTAYLISGVILNGRFEESYRALVSDGVFQKTNRDVAYQILSEDRGRGMVSYDYKVKDCMAKVNSVANPNIKMQVPPHDLTNRVQPFYAQYLYLSRYDLSMPMFSRAEYHRVVNKLSKLFGSEKVSQFLLRKKYDKTDLYDFIDINYNSLTIDQLKRLQSTVGLRFYIINKEKERIELNNYTLCSGKHYTVYDLKMIE